MSSPRKLVIITIVSMTAVLLALGSGCGGNKESKQPAQPTQTTPAADQPKARTTAPDQARATPPAAGGQSTATSTAAPGGPMMQRMMQSCPMMVEGVDVEATDTENGVAMTFTTTTGNVEELRERVRHMAEMYNLHHTRGGFMWHRMGGGPGGGPGAGPGAGMGPGHRMHHGGMGQGMGPMPAAVVVVEAVDHGARLVLTPRDPAQLDALRAHVRMHTERMRTHECPYQMQQQQ